MIVRTWNGKTPKNVTGRLIRDTGTGVIIEDSRGIRYFAQYRNIVIKSHNDLFGALENV